MCKNIVNVCFDKVLKRPQYLVNLSLYVRRRFFIAYECYIQLFLTSVRHYDKFISIKDLDEKLIKIFCSIDYGYVAIFRNIINNV